jgi:hypothetical protein
MSTFVRGRNETRKQPMETGTGYYGHVAITAGAVRERAPLEPALEIELKIQADGFAPGVAAMILPCAGGQAAG